jgi:hypothetical protein
VTTGSGSGRITGPGIDCPGDCAQRFFSGQRVQLAAHAAPGSRFAGWTEGCSGTGHCALTLTADSAVGASFVADPASAPTSLYLIASDRRIRRHDQISLEVRADPCPGRVGDPVTLTKNGRTNELARLGAGCRAHLRVRPRRTATFGARIDANGLYAAAEAEPVRIRVRPRLPAAK